MPVLCYLVNNPFKGFCGPVHKTKAVKKYEKMPCFEICKVAYNEGLLFVLSIFPNNFFLLILSTKHNTFYFVSVEHKYSDNFYL